MIAPTRWKVVGASVIGKQHERAAGRCEDAWSSARRGFPGGHEALAVCLSDGAGSATNGWVGAQMVSRVLANWLVDNAEKVFCGVADDRKRVIASTLKRVLRRAATGSGAALKSYACTVVAALIATDGRWLTVHLGDGGIVGSFGGTLRIVSAPRKGEFANETFFVTDNDAIESINIQSGQVSDSTPSPEAFALFTDGVEALLVNRRTGEVSKAFGSLFDRVLNDTESEATAALEYTLTHRFRELSPTGDDCSLAIVVQEPRPAAMPHEAVISCAEADNPGL